MEGLKEILCVEDKYPKYANFKSRILLKAQADLQQYTDISFTFEEHSDLGRKVDRLAFTIRKNKKQSMEVINAEEDTPDSDTQG